MPLRRLEGTQSLESSNKIPLPVLRLLINLHQAYTCACQFSGYIPDAVGRAMQMKAKWMCST